MRWALKRTFDYRDVFIFNSSLCKDGELPAVCQRKKIPQNAVAFLKKQTNERIQHASRYVNCNQIVAFWGLITKATTRLLLKYGSKVKHFPFGSWRSVAEESMSTAWWDLANYLAKFVKTKIFQRNLIILCPIYTEHNRW